MATPSPGSFGNPLLAIASYGIGRAISPILVPGIQDLANFAWAAHRISPLSAEAAAAAWVEGVWTKERADTEASYTGISTSRLEAIHDLLNDPPGIAMLYELWRRRQIDPAKFNEGLKHLRIEEDYWAGMHVLKDAVLDPADLARGIHRGLVPDPGLLRGELPSGVGHVPAYPVYDIAALREAEAAGYDRDHLGVLVGLQGNPMGAHEAAEAFFRHILTRDDYLRAIAEGNTRNEWADAILEQTRQIPTAREFLENALRGYRTLAEALKGAARHGMSIEDATMVYQNQGRPMAVRQITTALARGGVFQPEPGEITDPYRASIVEGNLKPAYYDLADANKYTYPSFFAIRALTQAGVYDADECYQILLEMGWKPDMARKVADFYGASPTATPTQDPRVKSAVTSAVSEVRSAYVLGQADAAAVRNWLGRLGVTVADELLPIWDVMREVPQTGLSSAQIKKAYRKTLYTREKAIAELQERGMTTADAVIYLDE